MPISAQRKPIIIIGGTVLAIVLFLGYLGTQEYAPAKVEARQQAKAVDPLTLSTSEQITLGLKAAPALVDQYDGLSTDATQKELLNRVGSLLAGHEMVGKAGWQFQFQLLAEPDVLNAFVLPGGQIFVTTGLLNRIRTEGEVAALLAHQIAHVLARDAITKLAVDMKETGADVTGADAQGLMVSQLVGLNFTTAQETAADALALKLMSDVGYSPNAMLGLLQVLGTAYYAGAQVEYFTTHPNPASRVADIQARIVELFPQGVPENMSK